ncbi:TPA: type III effector protein, partial [Escherichia coli]
ANNYINDKIDKCLKLSHCCLYYTCLGKLAGGINLYDCDITLTTRLSYDIASKTKSKTPAYMDMQSAVAENEISSFIKKLMEIHSRKKDVNVIDNWEKALVNLQHLLVNAIK